MKINTTEIQQLLIDWYDAHARCLPWRNDPTPYRVWVSEIMLQQTRVETVKPYFDRFLSELPTVFDLAAADEQVLLKLWEGLGYYSRVRNLKKAAVEIVGKYGGKLPTTVDELVKLPGIGPYSAGAVASIAFGIRTPAIDGNVLRVVARLTANRGDLAKKETKEEIEKVVRELLPETRIGDFNQALMELGATVCLPNGAPKCDICPVSTLCAAFSCGITALIPVKAGKKARRIEQRTVFVICCNHRTLLARRPEEGLLKGLWEFPNTEGHLSLDEAGDLLRGWMIPVKEILPLQKAKHIFTHIEWHMTGYLVHAEECESVLERDSAFVWALPAELKRKFTLPTAFKAYSAYCPENEEQY